MENGQKKKWVKRSVIGVAAVSVLGVSVALAAPATWGWDHMTTATATAYCLAKHPYVSATNYGGYTADGYQIVPAPGIVGAVRRNFVRNRSSINYDEGVKQNCQQACSQFGSMFGSSKGTALMQKVNAAGQLATSGIGDMGAMTVQDRDFYLLKDVVAGMWTRGNTWHESDVAQADYCCCELH